MSRRIETLFLPGPAGRLEALLEEPEEGEPAQAALVCHPHPLHGGTMHNKVVYRIARGLRRAGSVVLRFNYRSVNLSDGRFASGVGEVEDARVALEWLRGRYPQLPFVLAGFSFGAKIIQKLGCGSEAKLLIAAGFPAKTTDWNEYAHCTVPRVFVHSTHDEFGPREEFERYYAAARGEKHVVWIEARDHFFSDALDAVEEAVNSFARPRA